MGSQISQMWQDAADLYNTTANSSRIGILTPKNKKSGKKQRRASHDDSVAQGASDEQFSSTPLSGGNSGTSSDNMYTADDPRSPPRKDASFDRTPVILQEEQSALNKKDQADLRKRLFIENLEKAVDQQLEIQEIQNQRDVVAAAGDN